MDRHEHTAAQALDALTYRNAPMSLSRRRFLQTIVAGAGTAAAAAAFRPDGVGALIPRPTGQTDGVLLLVTLGGGNDGLNTVVPFGNSAYYDKRPEIALSADELLPLNGNLGLHPSLPFLHSEWSANRLAIVQGVGMTKAADLDFSHFVQMARWMRGWGGTGVPPTGWVGRWMDSGNSRSVNLMRAIHIGRGVPFHLVGAQTRGVSVPTTPGFGSLQGPLYNRLYGGARSLASTVNHPSPLAGQVVRTLRDQLDVSVSANPIYGSPFAGPPQVVKDFEAAARLINAGLGTRVISISLGGFDHHAGQRSTNIYDRGQHVLLAELNQGIEKFWASVNPTWAAKTTVMAYSEFGRRVIGNASQGSDHGAANCVFVMGPRVRGGLHGEYPSLTNTLANDQLKATVDFRQVYATIIDRCIGGDSKEVLGARYSTLNLFRGSWPMATADPVKDIDRTQIEVRTPIVPADEVVSAM
jgi:uncharacterized protein (DUF1501 family)